MEEEKGVKNEAADRHPRTLATWSDTNLDRSSFGDASFIQLQCRGCKGTLFEVFGTGSYETSARCHQCGMWYIVHSG